MLKRQIVIENYKAERCRHIFQYMSSKTGFLVSKLSITAITF